MTFTVRSDEPISIPPELLEELGRYRRQAKRLRVTIAPILKDRTMSQNSYFHAKVNEIARETGIDRDEIKRAIKLKAIGMGYPCMEEEDGTLRLDKSGEPIPVSTARATIEQMTILIEALHIWCAENEIPTEDYI